MTNILSLFATDFGAVSPGGIRGVISSLSAGAPESLHVTHVGIGPQAGPLPSPNDRYIGLGETVTAGESAGVNLTYLRRLWKARNDVFRNVDVVIAHRAEYALAVPASLPLLQVLHGGSWGWWRAQRNLPGLLYPLVEIVAGLRARRTLTVAPDAHSLVFDKLVRAEPFDVAYDDAVFMPANMSRMGDNPPCLVSTARLVREKRLDLIIKTAARMRIPAVHIFGAGPEHDFLADVAKRLGVTLTLYGQTTAGEISRWYRTHGCVFMLTSMFEGFPVSALEAAGCGVPVVALAAPGSSTAIPRIGGYIAQDVNDLPRAIKQAWGAGNSLSAQAVSDQFGTAAMTRKFWQAVAPHELSR